MARAGRDVLLIILVAGLVFFTNLGGPRLWDRDEPRNAGCAAEMLARGDWVTPVFNGELRPHKPALLYWCMMSAYAVLGVSEFAARFWSAAFGTGTLLLTYFIGDRLFGRRVARWSALILATTMMFGVASRAATPDATLIFFATLSIALYVGGTWSPSDSQTDQDSHARPAPGWYPRWGHAAVMFGVMGLAVLAKGPVGLVLPTAVIGMFLLLKRLPTEESQSLSAPSWQTRLVSLLRPFEPRHFLKTVWFMRPLTALGVVAVVAVPWYVWVHLRTNGAWTEGFFITHNLERATRAMEGHGGGLWYYPLALIVGCFPWSIFWMPALGDAIHCRRDGHRWRDGYLFAFCWVGVYLALFSLARTKLPSYITPCYPAVALLMGAFVDRWSRGELQLSVFWSRLAYGVLGIVGLIAAATVPVAARLMLPGEEVLGGIGIILLLASVFGWSQSELGHAREALRGTATAAVLLSTVVFGFAAVRVDQHRALDRLTGAVHAESADARVISFACLEPSWVFYCGRPIREYSDPAEAARQLASSQKGQAAEATSLITTVSRFEVLRPLLPPNSYSIEEVPNFLKDDALVVIRPKPAAVQTALSDDLGGEAVNR